MDVSDLCLELASPELASRIEAANALADAGEKGEDISAAVPALSLAALDESSALQGSAVTALACIGDAGGSLADAGPALVKALGSSEHYIRSNAAWSLQFVLKTQDVDGAATALAANLVHDKSVGNTRAAFEVALRGPAQKTAALALDTAMSGENPLIAGRAALIRTLDQAQRGEWPAINERIVSGATAVRQNALTGLIEAGEAEHDISPTLAALAIAMADPSMLVAKEALWAVVVIARQGHPIDAALEAMRARAAEPATEGNATIALALRDLDEGRTAEVEALLDHPTPDLNFAAAFAITDFSTRTKDEALLTRLLWKLPFGIANPSLVQGVAGSILAAIKRKDPKGPFVQNVLQKLIASTEDPVKQAPLYGVFQIVNERL